MAVFKGRKKVLIVDDEPIICELLSETLKHEGYETFIALDGKVGLEKARSERPDLILLDVMMPVMDGWKMLEQLRNDPQTEDIPVVMLTAKGETESMMRSQHYKVLDYFIKPVEAAELIKFLRRYVDLRPQE